MKRLVVLIGALAITLLSACAPAAAPTPDAMVKASPTADAMMAKVSPTVDAMMPKASPTVDAMMPETASMGKIADQMTGMHFVESSPKHGISLAKRPDLVQVTFNVALSETSTINVTKDGAVIMTGKLMLDGKMLSMSVTLPSDAGDGVYLVKYKACWADKTCDDGQFGFKVDSKAGM